MGMGYHGHKKQFKNWLMEILHLCSLLVYYCWTTQPVQVWGPKGPNPNCRLVAVRVYLLL